MLFFCISCDKKVAEPLNHMPTVQLRGEFRYGEATEVVLSNLPPGWQPRLRWYRDGEEVKHLSSDKYKLSKDDIGKRLKVSLEFLSSEADSTREGIRRIYSLETQPIAWNPNPPSLEGAPKLDSVIHIVPDDLPNKDWRIETAWYRDGNEISVYRDSLKYTLSPEDFGKKIRARIIYKYKEKIIADIFSQSDLEIDFEPTPPILDGVSRYDSILNVLPSPFPPEWKKEIRWYRTFDNGQTHDTIFSNNDVENLKIGFTEVGSKIRVGIRFKAPYFLGNKKIYSEAEELFSQWTDPVKFFDVPTPTLKGEPRIYSLLKASIYSKSGWEPKLRWYRGFPGDYEVIPGASDLLYEIKPEDAGKTFKIGLSLVHKSGISLPEEFSESTSYVAWSQPSPVLEGVPALYQTLTAKNFGDTPQGWLRRIKWYRKIANHVEEIPTPPGTESYVPSIDDVNNKIRCLVFYERPPSENGEGYFVTDGVYSDYVEIKVLPSQVKIAVPDGGKLECGQTIKAVLESKEVSERGWQFIWYRDTITSLGKYRISGAEEGEYRLGPRDVGKRIQVELFSRDIGSAQAYLRVSKFTDPVVQCPQPQITTPTDPTPAPTSVRIDKEISYVGQTLFAVVDNPSTPLGWTLYYNWYADGVKINGASGSQYKLSTLSMGRNITFAYYFLKPDGTSTLDIQTSDPVYVFPDVDMTVKGSFQLGTFLKVARGIPSDLTLPEGWTSKITWYIEGNEKQGYGPHGDYYLIELDDLGKEVVVAHDFINPNGEKKVSKRSNSFLLQKKDGDAPTLSFNHLKISSISGSRNVKRISLSIDEKMSTQDIRPSSDFQVKIRWYRRAPDGSREVINGFDNSLMYDIKSTDQGFLIEASLSLYLDGEKIAEYFSDVVGPIYDAKAMKVIPNISSLTILTVGNQITVGLRGGGIPNGITPEYNWYRDASASEVLLLNSSKYTCDLSDLDKRLVARVRFRSNKYYSEWGPPSAESNKVTFSTPLLSGTETGVDGYTVTANVPNVPKELLQYQWYKNGEKIGDITSENQYKLENQDVGLAIRANVCLKSSDNTCVWRTSGTHNINYSPFKPRHFMGAKLGYGFYVSAGMDLRNYTPPSVGVKMEFNWIVVPDSFKKEIEEYIRNGDSRGLELMVLHFSKSRISTNNIKQLFYSNEPRNNFLLLRCRFQRRITDERGNSMIWHSKWSDFRVKYPNKWHESDR